MFWILPCLVILGAVLWIIDGIRKIGAVSTGAPISGRAKQALVLIDLQEVFWTSGVFDETAKETARIRILAEIDTARSKGQAVIAVRQEWSIPATKVVAKLLMKGQAIAGTQGTEIAASFADLADVTLVKRVQDAFETNELDKILARLDVAHLRIVGLDLNYCVAKTAFAARHRGYEVVVVRDGVLSADAKLAEKTLLQLADQQVVLD